MARAGRAGPPLRESATGDTGAPLGEAAAGETNAPFAGSAASAHASSGRAGSTAARGPGAGPGAPAGALSSRAAGIDFVRRANVWIAAGAVAFAGAVTAVTAHAFHPKTAVAAQPATTSLPAIGDDGGTTTPQAAPAPAAPSPAPPVVSGGS